MELLDRLYYIHTLAYYTVIEEADQYEFLILRAKELLFSLFTLRAPLLLEYSFNEHITSVIFNVN